jgi:O-antigen/teichoic acid export membrane protein
MSRNKSGVSELVSGGFLRHSFVFFGGSLVVSALNYLFYPVLGRMLSTAAFGEVQALLSIFMQATIFLTVVAYVTIHVTVNQIDENARNSILLGLERVTLIIGYGLLLISLLCVGWLKQFFHFSDVWPFVSLIVALAVSLPLAFRMAFLRGKTLFAKALLTDGVGSAAKLVLSPLLILAGLGSLGAVSGLTISQFISLGLGLTWARRHGFSGFGLKTHKLSLKQLRPQFKHAGAILLASLVITSLLSADIIAAKHFFDPDQAGQYAGMTTVARIIFFLAAPLTAVLMTMVGLDHPQRKNRQQLIATIALIIVFGGLVLIPLSLFPEVIIKTLVGAKYFAYAQYLPRLALAMLILSIGHCGLMYQIALKRYGYCVSGLAALLLTFGLLVRGHASVIGIINAVLAGAAALIGLLVAQSLIKNNLTRRADG